ncbi:hypothetical protein [Hydrogenophaga sp. OTU3427]|uniref:hypothetical protein n=1 Tax=Hydrogenophaga sp. OTU3427 TaxID=3043856 RepID=UPI00313F2F79
MDNDDSVGAPVSRRFPHPAGGLTDRLENQSELLQEFVGWASEVNAAMAAYRALAMALIATHSQPNALLDHFQQGMDMVADAVPPDQVGDYRRELQMLQGLMLNAINRDPAR